MAARRRREPPAPAPPPGHAGGWRIGAIDPGLRPGAVELDWATGTVVRATHQLHGAAGEWIWTTPWDIFATESQWYYGARGPERNKVDVNDLLTLAFRAGFTLACVPAARSLRIPPKVWRAPYGNLNKEQVQKKIADNLTAAERHIIVSNVPAARHGDVLDAIGIARCARLVAMTTTTYDWKPPK